MQHPGTPWSPHVGDHVRIKGTRLQGIVQRINGERSERRFVISVHDHAVRKSIDARNGASDAVAARTVFWLEEIEPAR
jgi:hypothetical protein